MADDELNQDLPEAHAPWAPPAADDLPERLRVHRWPGCWVLPVSGFSMH